LPLWKKAGFQGASDEKDQDRFLGLLSRLRNWPAKQDFSFFLGLFPPHGSSSIL